MCGIAGIVSRELVSREKLAIAHRVQAHRGPDATDDASQLVGNWHVGLAHQRLAILDLSAAGTQPMQSASGRSSIIFNGEIYNFVEVRRELEALGHRFRTSTDTEVLLEALEEWGAAEALRRCNGMWAFAWLRFDERSLVLARDRAGKKPLNYTLSDDSFFFASEVKTILELSGRRFALDAQSVGEYLLQSLQEVSTRTFFEDISKVPAAHFGTIDLTAARSELRLTRYWDVDPTVETFRGTAEATIEHLRELFFDSVRLRLRSDVPVGVLLSGGLDSSSIAAAMHEIVGGGELNLLSAVSDDARFDESPHIDAVARHLSRPVRKVKLDAGAGNALPLVERLSWFNDEPVGSLSNVAHYLLMESARELGIVVVLTGQGADELLCGYRKFVPFYLQQLVREGRFIKAARVAGEFLARGTVGRQFTLREAKRYLPKALRPRQIDIAGAALRPFVPVNVRLGRSSLQERQKRDVTELSIPVLTHYEDRMSMACSREMRVPFLDYRLIELLLPMRADLKLHDGWTKYALRKAVEPYLPPEIVWRKDKQGFSNPQGEWLKNELRDEVLRYFAEDALIFRYRLVERNALLAAYEAYCRQDVNSGSYWFRDIFNPLALEIFLRRYEPYLRAT